MSGAVHEVARDVSVGSDMGAGRGGDGEREEAIEGGGRGAISHRGWVNGRGRGMRSDEDIHTHVSKTMRTVLSVLSSWPVTRPS